ncbi:MAG: FAD-dependent oxidoreductase, partial [Caldilineaceae bacterium]|nr:FAD-dependent oxidoreductase [Caldilineaceae bacterium]
MEVQQVDVIVIGAGQGGAPLAEAYAREGKRVVLFERDHVGGTCVNYGCLPSKAFLASAHAAADARNADRLGVHADVSVDFPRVMARARETTRSSRQSVRDRLVDAGVQVVEATAAFLNSNTVHGGIQVQAPVTVINTGKSPAIPPIPGLEAIDFLTYESFWTLDQLPARTLVLGGGYVGVELGQGIARLGSVTHIV